MPITCQICCREFSRQITNSHLRSHSLNTDQYRAQYGAHSLTCPIYRQQLSESRGGKKNSNYGKKWSDAQKKQASQSVTAAYKSGNRTAWNKGHVVTDPKTLANIRAGTQKREARYETGELKRATVNHSAETRELLSQRQRSYAEQNPEKMSARAYKALATKTAQGRDLAFFRGHKHTQSTKAELSQISRRINTEKTARMHERIQERAQSDDLLVVGYENLRVHLECRKCHSTFSFHRQTFTDSKWTGHLCFTCHPRHYRVSVAETEIADFIQTLRPSAIRNYRPVYHEFELDVYVPELQIGFEYNGLYWHSDSCLLYAGHSPTRDNEKRIHFNQQGIRVVQIFEDEWLSKPEHVKSRIRNILGHNLVRIGARQCRIRVIESAVLNDFLKHNHIMGRGRSNVALGLYYGAELVSVMSFTSSNPSRRFSRADNHWELDRFCSKLNTTVIGAAQKLFGYFVKHYDPKLVLSYSDNRWNTGDVYDRLGFEKIGDGRPNYWYFKPNELVRYHRYTLRKTTQDPVELTEYEIRTAEGYLRVWDCGSSKWVWTKK